jgi:ectoine hydroxylase-related dioxygenase (phytanoyl-CoA dioxygenase family)
MVAAAGLYSAPMRLTAEQRAHYDRHGYVVVEGGLEAADLAPVIAGYEAFIDAQARRLYESGALSRLFEDEPFERRLALLCQEDVSIYGRIDLMYSRLRGVFEFLRNRRLLDLVEGIVGPEIICSPIQHARAKLPESVLTRARSVDDEAAQRLRAMIGENVAPWHQDAQVHLEVADPHPILTVWIPLVDATPDNGCLQLIPDVHRERTVYWSDGFGVSDERLPAGDTVTLPMRAGDVLLMNKLTPHRSTANRTDGIRWSLDLRYQRSGTPTGRDFYPVFVARSHTDPDSELTDYEEWRSRWEQAVAAIGPDQRPRRQDRPTEPRPLEILP